MAHDGASVAPPSVDVSQRDDPRVLVLRQLDDLRHKLSALSVADKPVQKDSRCAGSHHHDQDDSFRGLGHPLACRRFFSHAAPPPDPCTTARDNGTRAGASWWTRHDLAWVVVPEVWVEELADMVLGAETIVYRIGSRGGVLRVSVPAELPELIAEFRRRVAEATMAAGDA